MAFAEGPLRAVLSTKGRKTGNEHAVELRAVYFGGKFYFSRRNPHSDWLKNALANPQVTVTVGDESFAGTAALVRDDQLARKISGLKYPDKRSEESRVVLEVTLCG
ncbi:MAG TPA: nitroreductase/quinone reductase family protein [Candidatus Nitrosotalea sp.]|nr:nitroreductase/quinone reductase family protein [Candidatus Nitrosotalea sp.]